MKTLMLFRGCSGSGKSSLVNLIDKLGVYSNYSIKNFEADNYFIDAAGKYNFQPTMLGAAHLSCLTNTENALKSETDLVIVSNTSTRESEVKPYQDLAEKYGYRFVSLIVENRHGGKSVHNLPDLVVEKQKERLLQSLKL